MVAPSRRLATLALTSSVVVAFLAAANASSPLYQRYAATWHTSPLTGTIAFATYAVAVLAGLLWLSQLPDVFGRRPVLFTAICAQIIALLLFAVAGSFTLIVVGRVVQGLASGAAFGVLSATMIEADAERGAIASAASPGTGSGLGALLSGLVVQFLPGPTHTIYLILAAVLAGQALIVLRLIPAGTRQASQDALRPRVRVAIPANARAVFLATAPVVFAVWALSGFYAALSPALYTTLSGSGAVWPTALPIFVLLWSGTLTTVVVRGASGRALTITGAVSTLAGLGATIVAIELGSAGLYLVASAVAGIGFGAGFQGPIRSLAPLATDDERPALLSAVFVVAYGGLGTAVIPGALLSAGASLTAVTVELAIALAVLSSIALGATLRAGVRVHP